MMNPSCEGSVSVEMRRKTLDSTPAFRDRRTGETHLSVEADGTPSAHHTFEHLPQSWVAARDATGAVCALHPAIEAGVWRNATFVALDELLAPRLDA